MLMADLDPGGKGSSAVDFCRVDGEASCHHPVHDLLKQAPDDHVLTLGIVAGHKGAHQTPGGHAAAEGTLLHQDHPDSFPGCSNGRAHTGRAAAHNHNIGTEALGNGSDIQLIHPKLPPVIILYVNGFLHCSGGPYRDGPH